jgi:calcineurin-like phosphoesterase family protein
VGPFYQKYHGEQVYFVGDLHIGHKNLVRGTSEWPDKDTACRNFNTIEEMNESILSSIVKVVKPNSILFLLGDILFGDKTKLKYWLDRIHCAEKNYILGNHCQWIRKSPEYQSLFNSCQDYLEIICYSRSGRKIPVCLFHYPVKQWNNANKGAYMLSGHSHGNLPYTENELGLDVGWDVFKRPISFFEVEDILSKRVYMAKDHHKSGE